MTVIAACGFQVMTMISMVLALVEWGGAMRHEMKSEYDQYIV